jgi:hypothetical protein
MMKEKRYHRGRLVLDCTRHNISMPNELWLWLQVQAESEGLTASSLLRKLTHDYKVSLEGGPVPPDYVLSVANQPPYPNSDGFPNPDKNRQILLT